MMGSRRTNEKDQPPTSANCNAPNLHLTHSAIFQEGNVSADHFDFIPDSLFLTPPSWEHIYSMNQPITQGLPETSGNSIDYLMNPTSFQNPQFNLNSITPNPDIPEVPSLPDWNTRWGPQFTNQGPNAMSAGGINDSNFDNPWSSKNPVTARNITGDLQMNRLGTFNRPQLDTPFVHTRNNVNLNTSQSGAQGKVEGSFLSLGIGGTEEGVPSSKPSSREVSNRLKEAAASELQMGRARKALSQSQTLDADFNGFQRESNASSLNHMFQITPTGNEVGVHCTPNPSPFKMQQNDMQHGISRDMSYGDVNHHRVFLGNQGTIGGTNSAQFLNSQQHGLNRVGTMYQTPSGQLQNIHFKAANSLPLENSINSSLKLGSSSTRQKYAGLQPLLQNHMAIQGHGGGGQLSQRTGVPQVGWVSSGQGGTDLPFPKRLGVEFNMRERDNPQAAVAHRGTSLQTTSTGQSQTCHFPDNRAPVHYPLNPQQTFFTHGQLQNGTVQLPRAPASVRSDLHVRPYANHKRSAVALPSPGPHWVQRQKMTPVTHPAVDHSMPIRIPTKPVTTSLVHPSIPLTQSQTHRPPPPIPVTTPPITRKDPEITPQLTKYKCLLCKRDLSMTSEGAVYQPTAPPPVAVLPCGHTFHDDCLEKITPKDQAKDPPCIPCALGED